MTEMIIEHLLGVICFVFGVICFIFILLPTYPIFLLIFAFGKMIGELDGVSYWKFTKDWFTFQYIP